MVAARTDCGRARDRNEDAYLVNQDLGILIVADGLGGHRGGDQASRLAVETLGEALSDYTSPTLSSLEVESGILKAFICAARKIREKASTDYHLKDMGTTAVLVLCSDDQIRVAHLGDSRAYILRDGTLMRLTEDHSIVEGLIRAGQLSSDDSRVHPLRHVVTRSLGQTDDATPTIRTAEWATGDRLLLCSDGLSNMLSDIEIQTMLQEDNVSCHDLCDRLVGLANDRGGLDNITIVLGQHL